MGNPAATLTFLGATRQVTGSRYLLETGDDRPAEVRIHGSQYPVRARIERLYGMSAHADREGLLEWVDRPGSPPKRIFLTHGEIEAADSLAAQIRQRLGWEVTVPEYGDAVELR